MTTSLLSLLGPAALALPLAVAPASAQAPAPSLPEEGVAVEEATPAEGAAEAPQDPTDERIAALTEQLQRMEEAQRQRESALTLNGYIDFGFFAPIGNRGAGWVRDVGNRQFDQYRSFSWVFLGDVLATTVNTRGEAADLGESPGIGTDTSLQRFDSVDSKGAASFIANEVNLRLSYQVGEKATARTSVNFVPRTGRDFDLGDFVDVDLAEVEYALTDDGSTAIFVGKTLPVFGIEYKERKSDQRFGITPSLVHRYTAGPQLGLKIRSRLLYDWIILAGSVTNNSSVTEQFHFQSEIDQNDAKTLNGRVALSIPVGRIAGALDGDRLEIGGSGMWGAQDFDTGNGKEIWLLGVDLQYLGSNFVLKAQGIRGKAPGDESESVWRLRLRNSGFVEVNVLPLPWLGLLGRAEVRDAFVSLGRDRAYLTKQMRFTGGLRFVLSPRAVVKAEYLHNREYGGIAEFKNDVFTSSLVLSF